jgi:hypothetical protein
LKSENRKFLWAGLAFLVAFVTYFITAAPTMAFWDCGERIACAHILGIPHPPGAPFFVLLGRFFILALPFFGEIAFRVNFLSFFAASISVGLTFLIIWDVLQLVISKEGPLGSVRNFCSGIGAWGGAFLLTFSQTFWFFAVEAETYATAMCFVMLVTYLSLLWYRKKQDVVLANRLMIMIVYVAFLGSGIHLYTLITLPVVFLFLLISDKSLREVEALPIWVASIVLYSAVYAISKFPLWTLVVISIAGIGALVAEDKWQKNLKMAFWVAVVGFLGFSTHAFIPIRSALNPAIDQNSPEIANVFEAKDWKVFNDFLERKQYGDESMITRAFYRRAQKLNQLLTFPHMGFGGYQFSQYLPWKVGQVAYVRSGEYVIPETENPPLVRGSMEFKTQMVLFNENRVPQWAYFLLFNGALFFICYALFKRNRSIGFYVGLLYVICSFGLIFYLNFADGTRPDKQVWDHYLQMRSMSPNTIPEPAPVHLEVRERDYFFLPGFMFMSLVFGLGLGLVAESVAKRRQDLLKPAGWAMLVLSFGVPLFSNYYERDRSGQWFPWDYAYNLLMSCDSNSVIFTNGDNDTFPLWFLQEVENIRKDVRVVNLSLGNTSWYIDQIRTNEPTLKLGWDSLAITRLDFNRSLRDSLNRSERYIQQLTTSLDELAGDLESVVSKNDSIGIARIRARDLRMRELRQLYSAFSHWARRSGGDLLRVQDQLVMEIVRHNPDRPIHFATTVASSNFIGLDRYMKMDGMVYTLVKGDERLIEGEMDYDKTRYLVDSVYLFRCLETDPCYFNLENRRMMGVYNSILLYLVVESNSRYRQFAQSGSSPVFAGMDTDSLANYYKEVTRNYLRRAINMFSDDFRNYLYAGQIYAEQGDAKAGLEIMQQGLPHLRGMEKQRLEQGIMQIQHSLD